MDQFIYKGQLFSNAPSINDQFDEEYMYSNYSTPTVTIVSSISNLVSDEDKFHSKLSPTLDIVFGTILVIAGILSLLGNSASLCVFYFRKRQLSPGEIFLVNLCVVDILLAVASYPASMVSAFYHGWIFGRNGCVLYASVCYFLGIASLASLQAISVIRYLKTCRPRIGTQINCITSVKILVGVYIYAFIWAVLPFFGLGNYELEPFNLSCTLHWTAQNTASRVYMVLVSIFNVFIPTFGMMYLYGHIILLVRRSDRIVGNTRTTRNVSDAQLTRMSVLITIGFVVGWGPYTVVSLYGAFTGELLLPMSATPFPVLMAKSSMAYNPLIYIFLTTRYRDDFYTLIRSWFRCWANSSNAVASSNNNREPAATIALNEGTFCEVTTQLLNPGDRRMPPLGRSNYLGVTGFSNSKLGSSSTTTTTEISASIQTTTESRAKNKMDQFQFQSPTGQDYENYDDSSTEDEDGPKCYKVSQV